MKNAFSLALLGGISLLILISILNAGTTLSLDSKLDKTISQIREAKRPAVLQITTINPECNGCTDISSFVDKVKQSNVNITSEKVLSAKNAKSLIASYKIQRLPAIILEGEIDRISAPNFEARERGLVYDQVAAPYYNTASGKVEGKVGVQMIMAPSCEKCQDMRQIVGIFAEQGVFFASNAELKSDNPDAQKLIASNGITKLPALIFSDEVSAYPDALEAMAQGGFRRSGDLHVYESRLPYYNLSSGEVQGLVDLVMLKDESCNECYDVSIHNQILANFGIAIGSEKTVDISSPEGRQLRQQYSITSVPAIVLKGDVMLYPGFSQVWETVGTIEKDNSFIFRNNEVLGSGFSYRNLATGEIVTVADTPAESGSG